MRPELFLQETVFCERAVKESEKSAETEYNRFILKNSGRHKKEDTMKHITDSMYQKRWGVFNHFLYDNLLKAENGKTEDEVSWDSFVDSFDTDQLAENLHKIGAGYYFVTVMQGRKYMCAPNAAYDRIAGTQPGEACAHRDLIEDLYRSLSKYGIDLYLYYTGDGPYKDEEIGRKFGFVEPRKNVSMDFVEKWAAVLEEYAVRYGDKVKGWWIDGSYDYFGYNNELMEPYYQAVKKGNPNAVVSFNSGQMITQGERGEELHLEKWFAKEDFTSGELNDFDHIPESAFVDGARSHLLIAVGRPDEGTNDPWCKKGTKRSHEFIKDYVEKVHSIGGVVTLDIHVDRYGRLDEEQVKALTGI